LENLFAIIHEDAGLLVVNKPAGLVCHPTKQGELSSLIGRVRLHLLSTINTQPSTIPQPPAFGLRPCLVNRLDRETSGVVLVAKNSALAGELGKIWESRAVEKEYLAIVHGHVRADYGLIDAPLGKDERSLVAVKDCVRPDGAPSQTEFWVERRFSHLGCPTVGRAGSPMPAAYVANAGAHGVTRPTELPTINSQPSTISQPSTYSLLRVIPKTGRKHQIRIHLAHLGHPIVGDKLYGGDEDHYLALVEDRLTPEQRARLILPHQALHARALRFTWRGQPMEFSCEPEPWFTGFLSADCAA